MSFLNYLEFNILYKRYDQMKDIEDFQYLKPSNQYIFKYVGAQLPGTDMLVHKVEVLNNNQWVITPLSLSEISSKHKNMEDIIELTEELSSDYIKFIFHKITNENYLKFLSDQELVDYDNFVNRKINENREYNERQVRKLQKEYS